MTNQTKINTALYPSDEERDKADNENSDSEDSFSDCPHFKDGKRVSHHNDKKLKNSKSFFGINFSMSLTHESNKESMRRLKVLLKKLLLLAFFLTILVFVMTQKFNVSKYKMSNGKCPPFYHEEFGGNCNRRTF